MLSLLVMLLWGSLFPAVKLGFAAFSVVTTGDILLFAGVRFLICGAVITLFALWRDRQSFSAVPSSVLPILLSGLFAIVLHYAFTYSGLQLTASGKTAILKQIGALLLHENILDPRYLAAFLLIGGGITVAQGLPKRKKKT